MTGAAVAPFWEVLDPHSPEALRTPAELAKSLIAEGFSLSYCRIPLSRERTPEAFDIPQLHRELAQGGGWLRDRQAADFVAAD